MFRIMYSNVNNWLCRVRRTKHNSHCYGKRQFVQLEFLETRLVPATFTVTNLNGNGLGSLTAAITAAEAHADSASTINFQSGLTGTITLTTVLPSIQKNLTINGPGSNVVTVARDTTGPAFRIFTVLGGSTTAISGLGITGGRATGAGTATHGGGVFNAGTLTLSDCSIYDNFAFEGGGGIFTDGDLTVSQCSIYLNVADGTNGGGIYNSDYLYLDSSEVFSNSAAWYGGGLYQNSSSSTIADYTDIYGNAADLGGGGIYVAAGTLTYNEGVIQSNATGGGAGEDGGGVYVETGTATFSELVEIKYNTANNGGGVFIADNGTASFVKCTVTGNTATVFAGIYVESDGHCITNGGTYQHIKQWGTCDMTSVAAPLTVIVCDQSGGTLTIDTSSLLTCTTFTLGGGTVSVTDGSTLEVEDTLTITDGLLSLDGSSAAVTLDVDTLNQSGGELTLSLATLYVSADYNLDAGVASIASSGGSITGELAIDEGALTLSNLTTSLTVSSGVSIGADGTLELIGGTIIADVVNAGILRLGTAASPMAGNTYTIDGDYTQTSTGYMIMDIDPWGVDGLTITGSATLDGVFQLNALSGADPNPPSSFTLITFDSLSGSFSSLTLPTLSSGKSWGHAYNSDDFTLSVSGGEGGGETGPGEG